MNKQSTLLLRDGPWERSIVPQLVDYIRIPNKSPHFDARWAEHGHMDHAVALILGGMHCMNRTRFVRLGHDQRTGNQPHQAPVWVSWIR